MIEKETWYCTQTKKVKTFTTLNILEHQRLKVWLWALKSLKSQKIIYCTNGLISIYSKTPHLLLSWRYLYNLSLQCYLIVIVYMSGRSNRTGMTFFFSMIHSAECGIDYQRLMTNEWINVFPLSWGRNSFPKLIYLTGDGIRVYNVWNRIFCCFVSIRLCQKTDICSWASHYLTLTFWGYLLFM